LHSYLTQNHEKATLYYLFFNHFSMYSFTKESLLKELIKWCNENSINNSKNTLESDVNVFLQMYSRDETSAYSDALLTELNLFIKNDKEYFINLKNHADISEQAFLYIFLYFIKDYSTQAISFKDLITGKTNLLKTLCLTEEKLLEYIEKLSYLTKNRIEYKEAAGIKQILVNYKIDERLLNTQLQQVYGIGLS
ncbi:MAG: DUF4007 family protein, partial [bacterium]